MRQDDFFPVVSMIWQSPLIHVVTPTKGLVTSQVTKTRALTKSLHSLSPVWWSSNHEQGHQDLLQAFTITTASFEGHPDHQDRLGAANHQE
jgi:hypothetical protein